MSAQILALAALSTIQPSFETSLNHLEVPQPFLDAAVLPSLDTRVPEVEPMIAALKQCVQRSPRAIRIGLSEEDSVPMARETVQLHAAPEFR